MRVKSGRPASTRVVSRSAGKKQKALPPLKLPEDDDDGDFRPRRGKKRSKESAAKTREIFDHDVDIDVEDLEDASENQVKSVFKREFADIKKRISPDADLRVDETAVAFFRTSLSLITDLMPIAEANYRKSGKEGAAYVISTLINQARDLSNDLRLSENIDERLDTVKLLIKANFDRIAELLLREMKYNMSTGVEGITTNTAIRKAIRQLMDDSIRSYGRGLEDIRQILNKQVSLYLQGDPNYLNPNNDEAEESPKKKKRGKKKKT